jgi:uncharacterized membrane protein YeaQ/YmgE (transglycosylase-associated protein family)
VAMRSCLCDAPEAGSGGIIVTMLIGVAAAMVGGWIATQLGFGTVGGFDIRSMLVAVGGAMVLLFGYWLVKKA